MEKRSAPKETNLGKKGFDNRNDVKKESTEKQKLEKIERSRHGYMYDVLSTKVTAKPKDTTYKPRFSTSFEKQNKEFRKIYLEKCDFIMSRQYILSPTTHEEIEFNQRITKTKEDL